MKNITAVFILMLLGIPALGQSHPAQRPHILGVDHVAFYTTAPDGVRKLYTEELGLAAADPVEPGENARYLVGTQWVGYSPAPDPKATDRMDHFAFRLTTSLPCVATWWRRDSSLRRFRDCRITA